MNRLDRNTIITRALDQVDAPSLDVKERPGGTLSATAMGIGWLQMALDFFYKHFPIKGVLTSSSITISGETVALPADFLIDYKNGVVLANDEGRLTRRSLDYLLSQPQATRTVPTMYSIEDTVLRVRPIPESSRTATLYYYKLPALLGATDIPPFPDDQVLTDLMELRYKEWLKMVPKGTSLEYARGQVAALQKAGIGNEPEPDQITFDRHYYGERVWDPNAWMGETTLSP